jgi:hypothetical protein
MLSLLGATGGAVNKITYNITFILSLLGATGGAVNKITYNKQRKSKGDMLFY